VSVCYSRMKGVLAALGLKTEQVVQLHSKQPKVPQELQMRVFGNVLGHLLAYTQAMID
jgi:hypothetical protein